MKISEVTVGKVNNLQGIITGMGEIQKTPQGVENRDCVLSDDEDQIKLVLWEAQVHQFKIGDKINIQAGFVKEFPTQSGQLQVSSGKFGKIVKL